MTDSYLMEADCIHGVTWFDCTECAVDEADLGPRYPKARVDMAAFMAVDAHFHLILETTAQLRRHGASEEEVTEYREDAVSDPVSTTARWVTTGKKGKA